MVIPIKKLNLIHIFLLVYIVEVLQIAVCFYFFGTNLDRFIKYGYWINVVWVVLTFLTAIATVYVLTVFTYFTVAFCMNILKRRNLIHHLLHLSLVILMGIIAICSLCYIITDLVFFLKGEERYSQAVDIFGDSVYGILAVIGLIGYIWIDHAVFMSKSNFHDQHPMRILVTSTSPHLVGDEVIDHDKERPPLFTAQY